MNNYHHRLLFGTRRIWPTLIKSIAVALLAFRLAKGQETSSAGAEPAYVQTDAGGFRLIIQPEKPLCRLDESVRIDILVTNLTEGALRIPEHDTITDFELIVKNERGQNVPLTEFGQRALRLTDFGRSTGQTIDSKGAVKYSIDVSRLYKIDVAGLYTLTARREFQVSANSAKLKLISNTIRIRIEK
jgi:hypothetical protein